MTTKQKSLIRMDSKGNKYVLLEISSVYESLKDENSSPLQFVNELERKELYTTGKKVKIPFLPASCTGCSSALKWIFAALPFDFEDYDPALSARISRKVTCDRCGTTNIVIDKSSCYDFFDKDLIPLSHFTSSLASYADELEKIRDEYLCFYSFKHLKGLKCSARNLWP